MFHNNFHVISGGPGAGKTAIIERLAARGFPVVAGSGRAILRQQIAIGGNAVHWGDAVAYRELMLARGMEDYERMTIETDVPVFFDRGVTELIGYCQLIGVPVPGHVQKAAEIFRYNPVVFIAPPWREIFAGDAERKQTFAEAVTTYELCATAYQDAGYALVEIPKASVAERANFILDHIDARSA